MRYANLLCVLCLAGCGGSGYGTESPTPDEMGVMREILRDYLSAQEIYYSQHNTYSPNVADFGISAERATLAVITADERGHAATISHDENDDKGCAVFVGNAAAPSTPGGRQLETPGVIRCD